MSDIVVRRARVADVEPILLLVNGLAQEQLMLPRSPMSVYEGLRDYVIAETGDGDFLGCGALHVVWGDLAEVRSLAVDRETRKAGVGRAIVDRIVADAKELGIPRLFAFTYVPGFFTKLGFHEVLHESLPHKVFGDCMHCPKFLACDEIAMVRELDIQRLASTPVVNAPPNSFPLPRRLADMQKQRRAGKAKQQ